jgi:outer membrane protein TolC
MRRPSFARLARLAGLAAAALVAVSVALTASPALAQPPAQRAGAEAGGGGGSGARHMRLDECVELALRNNVEVQSATDDVAVSEAQRSGSRGQIGPKVRIDAYAHEWNSPYEIPFGASSFPVRDQFEWNATVSASQPVTGLFAILGAVEVRSLGVDIANIRREVARRDTAYRVVESYYHLIQGQRLVEVASASVEQLQAQLKQSNSFHTNGVVSQDDVLRAQLAVANAEQRLIQTRSRVSLEQARLGVLVGLPDVTIDPQPIAPDLQKPREAMTLDQALKAAEAARIELVEVDKRIEQAGKEVKVAWARLAPQVNIVGAYIHNEGSQFVQTNSAYVGAQASWDVWDWGTNTSAVSEAKVRAHQALTARTRISDQIRLEVRRAFLELNAASEAMVVAQASVASAEENFRLVKKRYEASAATSFDVIDAEGLLTQSRGQMQTALYDQLVARAALRRAMGTGAEKVAAP